MSSGSANLTVADLGIEVIRKDIKHLHISVYPPLGRVRVAAPERMDDDTIRRAEQLRSEVTHLTVQNGGQHLGAITISVGVASYPANGSLLTELIAAADSSLYQAKAAGRNRVVTASAPAPA